jgi:pterin-4a-carbinolamine dehydratase
MPPPKKVAKKAAKNAAKATGHHHDKHNQARDLRRAYEHMGRVAVLRQASKSSRTDAIAELTTLAQQAIKDGHSKDAADLLRASEHFSFAALAGEFSGVAGDSRVSADLKESITDQFDDLTRRADEHWQEEEEHSETLTAIYESSRRSATKAFKARDYYQALEFARAAEALAHVKQHGPLKLESGRKKLQLESA